MRILRLLLDQMIDSDVAADLRAAGHDVCCIGEFGMARADDAEVLQYAIRENRILVTRDRDFGNLVFARGLGAGVLYLRILPSTQNATHEQLERVLKTHTEAELAKAFVVIEPGSHRIRRLPVIP